MEDRNPAIVLLGPTGSGKTPLGDFLSARGLPVVEVAERDAAASRSGEGNSASSLCVGSPWRSAGSRRGAHFDFGQNLRDVAERGVADSVVSAADLALVRCVLASGALLEDRDFPLAERLLRSFLIRRKVAADTCVILNGIPRHRGQAAALNRLLEVEYVVLLECSAETVLARIAVDAGGDRAGRIDDTLPEVQRKLEIFQQRTAPLVDYYEALGVPALRLPVGVSTSAEEMWQTLCCCFAGARSVGDRFKRDDEPLRRLTDGAEKAHVQHVRRGD